jgi:hypothetical protein
MFSVNFVTEGLREAMTAQLLVEIAVDANGNEVTDKAVFLQASTATVTPSQQSGQLTGILGPPVTDRVRFNLAIELRDATGRLVTSSERLLNLRPE